MANTPLPHTDPYVRCELHCSHDLGRGMSVSDLLGRDGPHADPKTAREWRTDTYRRSQVQSRRRYPVARRSLS